MASFGARVQISNHLHGSNSECALVWFSDVSGIQVFGFRTPTVVWFLDQVHSTLDVGCFTDKMQINCSRNSTQDAKKVVCENNYLI